MNVWIDDEREAPDNWLWLQSSDEALTLLDQLKFRGVTPAVISFDHDLGGDDTTRPIVLWMIEHEFWPVEIRIHSANFVGREWIQGMFNRYAPESVELNWNF